MTVNKLVTGQVPGTYGGDGEIPGSEGEYVLHTCLGRDHRAEAGSLEVRQCYGATQTPNFGGWLVACAAMAFNWIDWRQYDTAAMLLFAWRGQEPEEVLLGILFA